MAPHTEMKKNKGLKKHKKAQKEKSLAKRAAAAEKAKLKKAVTVEMEVEPVQAKENVDGNIGQQDKSSPADIMTKEDVVGSITLLAGVVEIRDDFSAVRNTAIINHGTTPMVETYAYFCENECVQESAAVDQDTSEDIKPKNLFTTNAFPHTDKDNMAPKQNHSIGDPVPTIQDTPPVEVFDIHTHRKALEAALYDNMESPMERLARINRAKSATITVEDALKEQYPALFSDYSFDDEPAPIKNRAVDTNGFDIIALRIAPPVEATITRPLSIDRLFAQVSDTGVSIVGNSSSSVKHPHTLEAIEMQQEVGSEVAQEGIDFHSMPIAQLFAAAAAEHTPIIRLPATTGDENARISRELDFIEAGMTFGCGDQISDIQPFIDPAIISCKAMEQQKGQEELQAVQDSAHHNPALEAAMYDGALKLKAMLGVGSPASGNKTTSQEGADKLKSLLGIGRPHIVSLDSSVHSRDSSPAREDGAYTPLTHYSVSPPPMPYQCGAVQDGYSFDGGIYPGWPPYGFAPPSFVPEHLAQPFFQECGSGQIHFASQPYHGLGWQHMGPAGYVPY